MNIEKSLYDIIILIILVVFRRHINEVLWKEILI